MHKSYCFNVLLYWIIYSSEPLQFLKGFNKYINIVENWRIVWEIPQNFLKFEFMCHAVMDWK